MGKESPLKGSFVLLRPRRSFKPAIKLLDILLQEYELVLSLLSIEHVGNNFRKWRVRYDFIAGKIGKNVSSQGDYIPIML
jgi:hypothetical protein